MDVRGAKKGQAGAGPLIENDFVQHREGDGGREPGALDHVADLDREGEHCPELLVCRATCTSVQV